MNSDYRQVQHYLAHFGIKGQSWYTRHFQSYETAPTRSGKVGQEVGDAAKQRSRLGQLKQNMQERKEAKAKNYKEHMDAYTSIDKMRRENKAARDDFSKKHPKLRLDQMDDDELMDLMAQEYLENPKQWNSDPENRWYGLDDSSAKGWLKMRDKELANNKQIRELSKKYGKANSKQQKELLMNRERERSYQIIEKRLNDSIKNVHKNNKYTAAQWKKENGGYLDNVDKEMLNDQLERDLQEAHKEYEQAKNRIDYQTAKKYSGHISNRKLKDLEWSVDNDTDDVLLGSYYYAGNIKKLRKAYK